MGRGGGKCDIEPRGGSGGSECWLVRGGRPPSPAPDKEEVRRLEDAGWKPMDVERPVEELGSPGRGGPRGALGMCTKPGLNSSIGVIFAMTSPEYSPEWVHVLRQS